MIDVYFPILTSEKLKLYKYYSLTGYNILALKERKFWACKPEEFNDPFDTPIEWVKLDSKTWTMPAGGKLDTKNPAPGVSKAPDRRASEKEIRDVKNLGITCFSSRIDSVVMWSHYADKHNGFTLEFEIDEKSVSIDSLLKVEYPGKMNSLGAQYKKQVARSKSTDWKYEKEYRLIIENGGGRLHDWPDQFKLMAVYLGLRMKENLKRSFSLFIREEFSDVLLNEVQRGELPFSLKFTVIK